MSWNTNNFFFFLFEPSFFLFRFFHFLSSSCSSCPPSASPSLTSRITPPFFFVLCSLLFLAFLIHSLSIRQHTPILSFPNSHHTQHSDCHADSNSRVTHLSGNCRQEYGHRHNRNSYGCINNKRNDGNGQSDFAPPPHLDRR